MMSVLRVCLFEAPNTGVSVPHSEAWLIASVLEWLEACKRGLHVKWALKTSLSLSFVFSVFRGSPDRDGGVSTS